MNIDRYYISGSSCANDIVNALAPTSAQRHGSTVTVVCIAGFSVTGGERVQTCDNGEWYGLSRESRMPTCSFYGIKPVFAWHFCVTM